MVDGDTFDIDLPQTVRLVGIDAPEGAQTCRDDGAEFPCGQRVTEAVRSLYDGARAICRWDETDRYGRYLATCEVAGRDVAADIVRLGLARVYRGDPTYAEEEKEARLLARGLWAYDMLDPAAWRAEQRAARAADFAPEAGSCPIKGNISKAGRLYHLPGSRAYGRTRIDESRGERWFCTEGEARAAGWRRAGG